jgi:hypothetical protein
MADGGKDDPNVGRVPRVMPRIWTDDYYERIYIVPDTASLRFSCEADSDVE